ncbi:MULTISPECIES: hypothetical protein [unclassified Psychrobacillus]|uniref:hypothetical protein n=1 Tax=unclassified Psychrobacillus TaxID=2636677 RepID=UPI0030FCB169
MKIKIKELCLVDYIKEEEMEKEHGEELMSVRTVIYSSQKETLLEAFQEYHNDFDIDNVIQSNDEFDGECNGFVKYLSVEEWE